MNQETFVAVVVEVLVIFGVSIWLGYFFARRDTRESLRYRQRLVAKRQPEFEGGTGVASESWTGMYRT